MQNLTRQVATTSETNDAREGRDDDEPPGAQAGGENGATARGAARGQSDAGTAPAVHASMATRFASVGVFAPDNQSRTVG
jgi:hypothetical protein